MIILLENRLKKQSGIEAKGTAQNKFEVKKYYERRFRKKRKVDYA